jgi:hypothetical protein
VFFNLFKDLFNLKEKNEEQLGNWRPVHSFEIFGGKHGYS